VVVFAGVVFGKMVVLTDVVLSALTVVVAGSAFDPWEK